MEDNFFAKVTQGLELGQQLRDQDQQSQARAFALQQAQAQAAREDQFRNAVPAYLSGGENALAGIYGSAPAAPQRSQAQAASELFRADPQRAIQLQELQARQNEFALQQHKRQVELEREQFRQAYEYGTHILGSAAPKKLVEIQQSNSPLAKKLLQIYQENGVDFSSLTDEQFKDHVREMTDQFRIKAGIAQPEKFKDERDSSGALLQRSTTTGQLKEITKPEKAASGAFDPAQADAAAQGIADYKLKPLGAFAMRTPYGQAVMAKVLELNPEYQENEFGARNQAYKSFAAGKNGNTIRSFNVAIDHLHTLEQAADALDNGNIRIFNKVGNTIAREFGVPEPKNFEGTKQIVAAEISKAIIGTGGALADRQELEKSINAADSPAQLIGVIGQYKKLLGGQLSGLKLQFEQSTGRDDFEKLLTPQSRQYLPPSGQAAQQPPTPAAPPPKANGQAPASAILHLKEHPELADFFKKKYGYLP